MPSFIFDENAPPYVPHYRFKKAQNQGPQIANTHRYTHPYWFCAQLTVTLQPWPDAHRAVLQWLERIEADGAHFTLPES